MLQRTWQEGAAEITKTVESLAPTQKLALAILLALAIVALAFEGAYVNAKFREQDQLRRDLDELRVHVDSIEGSASVGQGREKVCANLVRTERDIEKYNRSHPKKPMASVTDLRKELCGAGQ
jgi:hypothetical protein